MTTMPATITSGAVEPDFVPCETHGYPLNVPTVCGALDTRDGDATAVALQHAGYVGEHVEYDAPEDATAVADARLDQQIVNAATQHREGWWQLARLAAEAISLRRTRREQARRVAEIAGLAHCSTSYVRALHACADHYAPTHEYPSVSLGLFRACIAAATRTNQRAPDVLDDALAKGWHVREVQALGRAETVTYRLKPTACPDCGAKLGVTAMGMGGLPLPCPVCLSVAKADGRKLDEAYVVVGSLA